MIKISIEEVSEDKIKKNNIIKGKYIIAHSNFNRAYISDVPCKVISEPFIGTYKFSTFKKKEYTLCIKVVSCITGIPYILPYNTDLFDVYDDHISILRASEDFLHRGYTIYSDPETTRGTMSQVVNKQYYPMDNSYCELLSTHEDSWVAGEVVKIISEPYTDTIPYDNKILFVNVLKDDGSIVKCMFMEWKLLPYI